MATSPGFIPSSVIHDHLPSPSSSKHTPKITQRHLFLRKLFSDTSGLQYVLLSHFFQSVYELGEQEEMYLYMQEEEVEEWTAACKSSAYIVDCQEFSEQHSVFSLLFLDHTRLDIHLLTRPSVGNQDVFSSHELLRQASINRDGIKVSSTSLMFTYWFAYYCMEKEAFPHTYRTFFLSLNLDERFQVLEVMEETLGFQISNLHQAFRSPSSYKALVEYTLSSKGETGDTRFQTWRRGSWAYLSHLPHTFFQKVKN